MVCTKHGDGVEFSFSGSGLLLIYQLGVARTIQLANLHKYSFCLQLCFSPETCVRSSGSSGGALIAAALMVNTDLVAMKNFTMLSMRHLRKNPAVNTFKLKHYIRAAFSLVKIIELEKDSTPPIEREAIKNGRLAISVTGISDMQNHMITSFKEHHELEEAILASSAITPLGGYPFRLNRKGDDKLHGKFVIDGGFTVVQPTTTDESKVITISPFIQWKTDIAPSEALSLLWIFSPPDTETLEKVYHRGMRDALKYFNDPKQIEKFSKLAKTEKITLGEELQKIVEEDIRVNTFENYMKDPIYENREDTNFDFLIKLSESEQEEIQHKALQMTAFAAACTQYAILGAANLTRSLLVGIESQRRQILPESQWLLSLRKWLPDSTMGTVEQSLNSSFSNFKQLMDPVGIWNSVADALVEGKIPESIEQ